MRNEWCAGPGISLGGDPLEETDAYVYLGRELRSDSTVHTELMRRKRAAWAAYGSIREVTRQLQDPKLRSSLFDSHVLPALCYAAETWPLTKSTSAGSRSSPTPLTSYDEQSIDGPATFSEEKTIDGRLVSLSGFLPLISFDHRDDHQPDGATRSRSTLRCPTAPDDPPDRLLYALPTNTGLHAHAIETHGGIVIHAAPPAEEDLLSN
ncbi:hypothetical protein PRIPAC_76053 [Pristionchus pacificus]|uniref:Uncharacterized protein n=1 Tax=Pristionchus pacificus TaxID=54126 RepID=A0A2A6B5B9_PRIPA|nr:hypothetical protein PRIPAC_76053 [Pristionchus pacificus]|eukprot:PDM61072.1 hypothetical protein PRIPAC_54878 [Pristionchus pacificus]